MIRMVFLRGAWGLLIALGVAWSAQAAELRDVRLSTGADSAQVTLQLSGETTHKLFTLDGPDRVVVDLGNTRMSSAVRAPNGTGPVDVIRFGARPKGELRVVVQLKTGMPVRSSWVSNAGGGATLVIDMGKPGSIAPPSQPVASPVQTKPQSVPAAPVEQSPQAVRAPHAPLENDRDIVIAVDAGHGGRDPGSMGKNGTREKDVALAVAQLLAKRINSEPGMRAVLTRSSDEFVMLGDRVQRARAARADMFISVHADSIRDRTIAGSSVYILSRGRATNEASRWLAEKENAADLMGGVSLDDKDATLASVLLNLSQTASIGSSNDVAERVLEALDRVGTVRKSMVQQGSFRVLTAPDIPSILVETAYISNPAEEKRLKTRSHQEKLASAIYSGVRGYFESYPPPGTRFASLRRSTVARTLASPAP